MLSSLHTSTKTSFVCSWYNHYQSFDAKEVSKFPHLESVTLDQVVTQFQTMTLGGDNGLSAAEKKALITRNLQETLGEDRIEEVRKKAALLIVHV